MNKPVISVRGVGKKYRLGATISSDTLRDQIAHAFKSIFNRNTTISSLDEIKKIKGQRRDTSDFWALRDISFDVHQGEVIGIIGPNGAGKTTLLKILSEITDPTTGEILIRGRVGSLLEVGTGFHPELSGRENIFLNGAILGMTHSEITKKFDEIVAFSEIEKFIDTPVKRYSSGMSVRLAFSIAAHFDPEIIFIDEVLAVGDVRFQKKCIGKMDEVSRSGRTILFVSHVMSAIESLCSKSILLNGGHLLSFGPTAEIIEMYLSMTTGDILNTGPRVGNFTRAKEISGIIRRVALFNSRKEQSTQIRIGDKFEFLIDLEANEAKHDLAVGLHIKNEAMKRVTSFHTRYNQCPYLNLNEKLSLRCKCNEIFLIPGKYYLEVAIAVSGSIEDRVENAFMFFIIDGDVFGTGKIPPLKDGVLISKGYWEVSNS